MDDLFEFTLILLGISLVSIACIALTITKSWWRVTSLIHTFTSKEEYIIVIGLSRIGLRIANDARNKAKKVIVISEDGTNTLSDELHLNGVKVISVKNINEDALFKAGIKRATSCLVVSENDEYNINLAKSIIDLKKKRGGSIKLSLIVHVANWYTRNLLIDQISSFSSSKNISTRFFDINHNAAKLIYDRFPPHNYLNDETNRNDERIVCVLGNNKISEAFLLENAILSHYPNSKQLKILFLCENAEQVLDGLTKKFPFLLEYINLVPVELLNTSFSSKLKWSSEFMISIPKIDAAYFFGDDDAKILSTALHFKQFLYNNTKNLRKVPVVVNLPEKTRIFQLLNSGVNQNKSIAEKYKDDLVIHFVRTVFDSCTYENLISQNDIETLAKTVNYFSAVKYEFDSILTTHFKKSNNLNLLGELESKILNFKVKKGDPLSQIEAFILQALKGYTKNSDYRVKQYFGINEIWNNTSERNKDSNRYVVRSSPVKLSILGELKVNEIVEESLKEHMESLGSVEHNRWSAEKLVADFAFGNLPENDTALKKIIKGSLKIHDQLKKFDQLDHLNKKKDIDMFLILPLLDKIKKNIIR